MSPEIIIQTLINGLLIGGVYSLVSIGLTLIYGVMIILNFAHGEFLMLGMYVTYWAFTLMGIHPYVSVILSTALLFLLGMLIQSGLVQRVLGANVLNQILLLLGVSTLLVGLAQMFFDPDPRTLRLPLSSMSINIGDLIINVPRLIAFFASMLIAGGLYLFLRRTKMGKAIRACSQSRDAAKLVGINVKSIYMITFGIGAAVTGVAGSLIMPFFPATPTVGSAFSVTAFVVVVLGTMGNFIGAFFGGLIIGVAETFGGFFLGGDIKQVVSMVIFILVLMLKPQGLFGKPRS
jgi:branched-chain amino acid transport system permease protein